MMKCMHYDCTKFAIFKNKMNEMIMFLESPAEMCSSVHSVLCVNYTDPRLSRFHLFQFICTEKSSFIVELIKAVTL